MILGINLYDFHFKFIGNNDISEVGAARLSEYVSKFHNLTTLNFDIRHKF
jgi:hypothetical protein